MVRQGKINGCKADQINLDTGSTLTMVYKRFVPVAVNTGKRVFMRNTTGMQSYPMAVVTI